MVLDKKATLYSRDEKGKLIPEEVKLEIDEQDEEQEQYKGDTIIMIPMARGEIKKMFRELKKNVEHEDTENELDIDSNLIEKYCIEPNYTDKDIQHMKQPLPSILVNTILRESGITPKKSKRKAIEEKEDEFAKNSDELNLTEKKGI